jgi:hypothetical protein
MNTKTFLLQYFLVAILLVCSTAINADKSTTLQSTKSTTTPITVANPMATTPQSTKSTITPVSLADPASYSAELNYCIGGTRICSLGYGGTDGRGSPCRCGNVHGTVC